MWRKRVIVNKLRNSSWQNAVSCRNYRRSFKASWRKEKEKVENPNFDPCWLAALESLFSSQDPTPHGEKGLAHFKPFLVFADSACHVNLKIESHEYTVCIGTICSTLYIPCLGFFRAQVLRNEEGRFRPWLLHRWRTRSQVWQICELRWVLACQTNAIQHCMHMYHIEQCNTISVLYIICRGRSHMTKITCL